MSLPETCPFCGAGPGQYVNSYMCGTYLRPNVANRVHQTKMCIVSERVRLAARVAELEARCKRLEEAGDAVLGGVPASFQGAWQQAKEAKP